MKLYEHYLKFILKKTFHVVKLTSSANFLLNQFPRSQNVGTAGSIHTP